MRDVRWTVTMDPEYALALSGGRLLVGTTVWGAVEVTGTRRSSFTNTDEPVKDSTAFNVDGKVTTSGDTVTYRPGSSRGQLVKAAQPPAIDNAGCQTTAIRASGKLCRQLT
ncbi:hypothetical protein [Actinoplanes sp. NPDC049265]|uniref:hypothetical protein n=1 Tax=Actinoplanes sp. NPDC049265 TaxID=3363902 RepID=UPI0037200A87